MPGNAEVQGRADRLAIREIMSIGFNGDTNCPCCFRPGLARPLVCMPSGGPKTSGNKIDIIRELLKVHGIGAYVQPMGDAHTSEYISDADKRVEWLTGFK